MQTRSHHLPSLFLAIFSGLGILSTFSGGVFMLLSGALALARSALFPNSAASPSNDFLLASGLFLCATLLIPSGHYSLRRLRDKPIKPATIRPIRFWQVIVILALWCSAVLLGNWLGNIFKISWPVTPFFLPAIALPVLALLWIGLGGLPLGSRQRLWGTFGIGLLAGPGLAIMAEFMIYLGLAVLGIVLLLAHPEWTGTFSQIQAQLSTARDLDTILTILAPYLMNPLVILLAFVVMSGLVPLIEELFKPVAVWLLAGRLRTPAQGFALGALSGAGFALVEGLVAGSSAGEGWSVLAVARVGGSLMHILATGLMGWGIASARHERRILDLIGSYSLSVSIHGLWNGMTMTIVLGAMRVFLAGSRPDALGVFLGTAGMVVLAILSVLTLIALILINRKLRPVPLVLVPTPPHNGSSESCHYVV